MSSYSLAKLSITFFGLILAATVVRPEIELWIAMRGQHTKEPEHPSIVMLGDSHTHFVDWRLLLRCSRIANAGVGGDDTGQILARLPQVLAASPRLVVLLAGTNDARRYMPKEKTIANLHTIREMVESRGIRYISLSPPPLPSRGDAINTSIEAAMIRIPFTRDDLLDDQIHLRRSGYAKWRDAIMSIVTSYCSLSRLL